MWGEILSGMEFHVGVEFQSGWNFIWGGILCGVEFYSKWGGMSKIVILYEFFQFSERLASKRTEPLNSSIEDGSESLNMLGYFSTKPWSCIKSRNLAGDGRTLKINTASNNNRDVPECVNTRKTRELRLYATRENFQFQTRQKSGVILLACFQMFQ